MKPTDKAPRGSQALSPVHALNLQVLIQLREALRVDPAQASYDYCIDRPTAEILRNASDEGLQSLSYSVDRALFRLGLSGPELTDILEKPPRLRGIFAAVRVPGPGSSPGR